MTTETRVVVAIRHRAANEYDCDACDGLSRWLDVDGAMAASRLTAREIFRFIDAGHLHFYEGQSGAVLICSASLAATRGGDQGGTK